ncbi:carbonic anhydrase [bacterium]|nr:carbonic anhydrase [bacterium]
MKNILKGLETFQLTIFEKEQELFARLAQGQSPDTLLITCSDSRISPDMLLQVRPGELFVMRNAGNIVPAYGASNGGEAAALEFAVAVLGVKDIIVLGHSGCGALKAVLAPETVSHLPALSQWIRQAEATRRIVVENHADLEGAALLEKAIGHNVLRQLDNLRTHPSVASRLERGDLSLHAWCYSIEEGLVRGFNSTTKSFDALVGERSTAIR